MGALAGMAGAAGGAGAAAGAAGGGASMFSQLIPMLQTASTAYNLASPQGPIAQGNIGGILQGGTQLAQQGQQLFGSPQTASASMVPSNTGSVQGSPEILGRGTADSFTKLTPDVQKEVLRILLDK